MRLQSYSLLLIFLFCLSNQKGTAQSQSVSIFKNGTGFFSKTLQLDAENKHVIVQSIPDVTFGTLWFFSNDNPIKSIRSSNQEIAGELQDARSVIEILKANTGRRIKITLNNEQIHEGFVESMKDDVLIFKKVTNVWLTLHPAEVKLIEFLESPALQFRNKQSEKVIDITLENANRKQELELMYLKSGITWLPNYSLELLADNKARIILKATLMNDAEDLENAQINFVVGVPNFTYNNLSDPLTTNQGVLDFLSVLNYSGNYYNPSNRRSDNIQAQSLSNNFGSISLERESTEITAIADLEGQNAEDLFFYNLNNINLKKGERAYYQVLESEVSYKDIYEVELESNQAQSTAYYTQAINKAENINQVWHSLRLENNTKLPWTTGTIMVSTKINNVQKALSQNKLNYTPSGGGSKIKMTIAPNMVVKDSEKEIQREENIKMKDGNFYDLVTVEGKIEIQSFRDEPTQLSIERKVIGEMKQSNEPWQITKLLDIYKSANSCNQIEWKMDIEAGKTKEITYTYKIHIIR